MIGKSCPKPHLCVSSDALVRPDSDDLAQVLLEDGSLGVYEAVLDFARVENADRRIALGMRFVKVLWHDVGSANSSATSQRRFSIFKGVDGHAGVFVMGASPTWILASDHGPVQAHAFHEKPVSAFAGDLGPASNAYLACINNVSCSPLSFISSNRLLRKS